MGNDQYGLERMKKRYYKMIEISPFTTLYENFEDGSDLAGSGTNNHAWSGGGLTILSQYVCGLQPVEPAWKTFRVKPQLGDLQYAEAGNVTVAGKISVRTEQNTSGMKIMLTVPDGSGAIVYIPEKYKSIEINGVSVFNRKFIQNSLASSEGEDEGCHCIRLAGGDFELIAR